MTARKTSAVLSALTATGSKASSSKADPVTLSDIVGSEAYIRTLSLMTSATATADDAAAIGTLTVGQVKARLMDVSKAAAALAKTLTADDVRVSSKDGLKAYAYAVVKPESGAASIGLTLSDGMGESLAKHAKRGAPTA